MQDRMKEEEGRKCEEKKREKRNTQKQHSTPYLHRIPSNPTPQTALRTESNTKEWLFTTLLLRLLDGEGVVLVLV